MEDTIRRALSDVLNINDVSNLSMQDSLEDIGLDSINFVTLIVMLEDAFDIQVPEDKLKYENFQTIKKILKVIGELINDKKI